MSDSDSWCTARRLGEVCEEKASGSWVVSLCERILVHFLQQVSSLLGTVKQMDNALQRRSSQQQRGGGRGVMGGRGSGALTDSDKIQLQLLLDVKEFGEELLKVGVDPGSSPGYSKLIAEVEEATKVVIGND